MQFVNTNEVSTKVIVNLRKPSQVIDLKEVYTKEELQFLTDSIKHNADLSDYMERNLIKGFTNKPLSDAQILELLTEYPDDFKAYAMEWFSNHSFGSIQLNRLISNPVQVITRVFINYRNVLHLESHFDSEINDSSDSSDNCWFCRKPSGEMFDTEFDTFLHRQCLVNVLEQDPEHPEAKFMKYLLD